MKTLPVALAALAASACTMLTAEAPLFAPSDQDPAFTLAEGLWVARDSDCKVNPAHSRPARKSCLEWMRVARAADGAWLVSDATDSAGGDDAEHIVFVAAAPATGRAPLYVAETVNARTGAINYGAVAARSDGDGPVTRIAATGIECAVATGEWGDIAGIAVTREDGKVVRCVASTKDAVREAARRAAISALPTFGTNELAFVRP